jgi:putative membrane protein
MRRFRVVMAVAAVMACSGGALADSMAEVVPVATSRVSASASEFAAQATQYALTEIELGKLADQKGSKVGITALGARLARDHNRLNTVLQSISRDKGLTTPVGLDERGEAVVQRLSALSGPAFDAGYAKLIASDHANLISLYTQASQSDDPQLSEFASRALPLLREHKRLGEVYVKVTSGYQPVGSRE